MNFDKIEKKLSISLPNYYKSVFSDYPFEAKDDLDFVEDNLVKETEWLITTNLELRECKFFGNIWPSHFFAIGHDGFGDFSFINLSEPDFKIYFVDHEEEFDQNDLASLELYPNMVEYIAGCIEEQIDVISNS